MAKDYLLHLKGFVGGYSFDPDYIDFKLNNAKGKEVDILIDSRGGDTFSAMSIVDSFRRHGKVNIHFVGFNASAATIASMGAKHVSMDRYAMYLVHKCSTFLFEWAQYNADELSTKIAALEKTRRDLIKIDHNIAALYASRCKKTKDELLDLMKEGGWISAQDALDWGFIDEITDWKEDEKPKMTAEIAACFAEAGIPIPGNFHPNFFELAVSRFKSLFESISTKNIESMNFKLKNICSFLGIEEIENNLSKEQAEVVESRIVEIVNASAEKDTRIAELESNVSTLEAKIAELEANPGATTNHVIETKPKEEEKTIDDSIESYVSSIKKARDIYNALP